MVKYTKDANGIEWTYNTKQKRFYCTDADNEFIAEGLDPMLNGFILEPYELLGFMIGTDASHDFDTRTAYEFWQGVILSTRKTNESQAVIGGNQ